MALENRLKEYRARLGINQADMGKLALVAMLLHMVWNTGVLAIIIPAFLWILSASNYCRCCVTKKSEKLAK